MSFAWRRGKSQRSCRRCVGKTDRNDAHGIAQIVRTGWYNAVHMKSRQSHEITTLLSARKVLLTKCIDLENEIRGLVKAFGIRLPAPLKRRHFDEAVRETIESDDGLRYAPLPMLEARGVLYAAFIEMERRVGAGARHDPVCLLLMTAPGVGPVTALSYKAAVAEHPVDRPSLSEAQLRVLSSHSTSPTGRAGTQH